MDFKVSEDLTFWAQKRIPKVMLKKFQVVCLVRFEKEKWHCNLSIHPLKHFWLR